MLRPKYRLTLQVGDKFMYAVHHEARAINIDRSTIIVIIV
jgi:hypothetical protein